jgi:hypothetical protein
MMKLEILDQFLVDWFVKLLLEYIVDDVALSWVTTKELVIMIAQQLYLIYSYTQNLSHLSIAPWFCIPDTMENILSCSLSIKDKKIHFMEVEHIIFPFVN